MNTGLSHFFDRARWIAAMLVVYGHASKLSLAHVVMDQPGSIIGQVLVELSLFGHAAVMIFFVMSGYLVGGTVLEQYKKKSFQISGYLINRFSRLYLVLVLAILVGAAFDLCGLFWLNSNRVYDLDQGTVWFDVHKQLSWSILGINLANCQTILGPAIGSNSPLWSLANEWWYYLFWPALLGAWYRKNIAHRLACIAIVLFLMWFLPSEMLLYFNIWILGAVASRLTWRPPIPASVIAITCAIAAWAGHTSIVDIWMTGIFHFGLLARLVPDLILAVLFSLWILRIKNRPTQVDQPITPNPSSILSCFPHRFMADFSYSVYLAHQPFLLLALAFCSNVFGYGIQLPLVWTTGLFLAALIGLVYLYALGIWFITERNTQVFRNWLRKILGLSKPAQPI